MKQLKRNYQLIKLFIIIADCCILAMLGISTVFNLLQGDLLTAFLPWLVLIFIVLVEMIIIIYYRNIVVDVSFDGKGNITIQTNCREWIFPVSAVKQVEVSRLQARSFLTCQNGTERKVFTYQMKYSPFKTYYLNMEELRENLVNAKFFES